MSDKRNGFVKWFDAKKGYGFISVDDQDDVFVHFSKFRMDVFKRFDIGDEVEFELQNSKDGKALEALNVANVSKD